LPAEVAEPELREFRRQLGANETMLIAFIGDFQILTNTKLYLWLLRMSFRIGMSWAFFVESGSDLI
jgi:hypothetical protein